MGLHLIPQVLSTSKVLQYYNATMQHCNYDLYQQTCTKTTLVTHIKTHINIDELEGHVPSATKYSDIINTNIRPYVHTEKHEAKIGFCVHYKNVYYSYDINWGYLYIR